MVFDLFFVFLVFVVFTAVQDEKIGLKFQGSEVI